MANEQIIRHDIIQLDFDTNLKELTKVTKELDELKKSISGGLGDEEFDKLKDSANDADDALGKVKKAANGVDDSLDKVKKAANGADSSLDKVKKSANSADDALDDVKKSANNADDSLDDVKKSADNVNSALKKVKTAASNASSKLVDLGKKGATAAFNGLKKIAGLSFKGLTVGLTTIATGLGYCVSKSLSLAGELEQNIGGSESVFGDLGKSISDMNMVLEKYDSATGKVTKTTGTLETVSANAYKTMGLSQSDYLATVNKMGSLMQGSGLDVQSSLNLSSLAMQRAADVASIMGVDIDMAMESIAGAAKGNFTMMDNLGVKMDATTIETYALSKGIKKTYAQMDNATKVQLAMQMFLEKTAYATGNYAKENDTYAGSLQTMKSAWENLLGALATGVDLDVHVNNMVESVEAFGAKAIPMAEKALVGIGQVVDKLAPIIADRLPNLVDKLLPPLIKAATSLLSALIKSLPKIVKTIINEAPEIFKELGSAIAETFGDQFPALKQFGNSLMENSKKISKCVPYILGLVGALMALSKIKSVAGVLSGLFGGKDGGGKKGGMFGGLADLAKIPVKTVLKGMANLGIIFGGMMILATAYMALAPHIAKLSDLKSVAKVAVVIGITGILGTALAKLGEIAGKIPVATVAKGLANMAIMLVGVGALSVALAWVTTKVNKMIDVPSILKLAVIMLAVGTVGTVLSVFAGIVGMIPIPVVLAGLANMALVLGGVSALIVAFGALSKIEGFSEFIAKGGKILAQIFGVIGEMVGSLAGGLIEGIAGSLPAVGESLGEFGENIKPLFTSIKGVDMGGVGAFFTSLVGLLGIATGNEIVEGIKSFFGGDDESSLSKLGTQLSDFAANSKDFFADVSKLPENGFSNATKLFDCLAGLKSLPKDGGVVGWFTGSIDYEKLANGLGQLASQKVIDFFNVVSGLKQTGFDNAALLFDTLAGMKSLPQDGGVVGWFSGEVDYSSIATGLGQLSGEKVKNFFTMVGALKKKAFDNAKLFFDCLASISDLPKEGGWWDKLTGTETSTLGNIAKELGNFGDNTAVFFEQINSLKLSNLNGLWESLKKSKDVTANVSKLVDEHIDDIVDKISELPKQMGDALKSSGKTLGDSLVSVWKDAVKASVSPVNKVLEAANWILKEFGSKKRVITWTPYAGGTGGHKGGNAVVNDGNGAELVQMPNGNAFIPTGRNVFIPNAPKGMKVLPADQTAQIMGKTSPTFHYADGIGDIDLWSYIDNSKGLVSKINDRVSYDGMSGFVLSLGKGMVSTFTGEMSAWIDKLFEEEGALSLANYVASKGVSQWRTTVARALKMEGQYSAANVERTLYQMQTESGGNPRAINLWDSNAKKGIPSKGLMQVIDPTFKAYARNGFDKNIYDPLSNILASIRYAVSRYGSLAKAYQGKGYSNGGIATKPSVFGEDGEEMAIPLTADKRKRAIDLWAETGYRLGLSAYTPERDSGEYTTNYTEYNTYSPSFSVTISGTNDDRAMARKVKKWISESLDEAFESMSSKNPRIQEV